MIENIIKRSGKVEKYNRGKIEIAINKAIYAVTKENDYKKASFLTDFVERKLRDTIMGEHYGYIPDIETIQNIVENVLVENNNYDLAKAYILYRAKREGARDSQKMLLDINKTMDGYLGQGDWRVRENSNVNFSLGGLILHNSGSITANYWLKNIYPKEIAEAHQNCAFHLHDLSMLSPYCAGWSIRQLLQEGLGGVPDKISSTPPKHLSTAVQQMVNFLGVLQNEWAGAQAFSSFDTYLAPFIKKENLSEKEVRQALQNFLFGVNTPSRWGCVPLDTEILTKEGWKNYKDLRVGDKTIGFDKGHLIDDEVLKINEYDYKGDMISLKNLKQDQLLTPNHRCIYRKYSHKVYNTENEFTVNEAGVIYNFNSYIDIPVTGVSTKKDFNISDDIIKLYSWLLFKGSFDDKNNSNISITAFNFSIYNSELRDIFKNLKIPFVIEEIIDKRTKYKSGYSYIFSIPKEINEYFKPLLDKKLNMSLFRKLSQRQLKIFLQETCKSSYYLRNKNTIKIFDKSLLDDMIELAFLAGYSFSVRDSVERNITQVKPCMILSLSKTDKMTTTIRDKKKEVYNGKVWCPTTKSSFWVAKRNNTVFITGNSQAPFTNITLDWVCPTDLRKQPVYIGGEKTDMVYGDCQKEMDMINKIFIELMLEGDANGRGFQYPIPTYNITSDFDWDSANAELLFKMTSKYGTPYFQNFINSDLNPEDVRSMCVLGETKVRARVKGKALHIGIKELFDKYDLKDIEVLTRWGYRPLERTIILPYKGLMYKIELENGVILSTTSDHPHLIYESDNLNVKSKLKIALAKDLKVGNVFSVRDEDSIFCRINRERKGKTVEQIYGKEKGMDYRNKCSERNKKIGKWIGKENPVYYITEDTKLKISKSMKNHFVSNNCRYLSSLRWKEKNPTRTQQYWDKVSIKESNVKNISKYETSFKEELKSLGLKYKHQYLLEDNNGEFLCVADFYIPSKNLIVELETHFNSNKCFYNEEVAQSPYIKKPLNEKILELGYNLLVFNPEKTDGSYRGLINHKVKIKNIFTYEYDGLVYDLEIKVNEGGLKNDLAHTFYANNVLTHNCCRLQLDKRELRKRGGGIFGSDEFTGSIGVVTINLPQLGYLSKDEVDFYKRLDYLLELARQSLQIKRKVIQQLLDGGLYPYTKRYLKHLNNHFNTIGICGMNECCLNFLGVDISNKKGKEFAEKVLDYLLDKARDFQENDKLALYNIEATPAESTSFRFAKHDKENYPDIITSGTIDEPYYTNSTHLPVQYTTDVFEALDHQESLQRKYTGGTVIHVYLGEAVKDWQSCRDLVKSIAYNYKIPYFSISPTFSVCPIHGYLEGEQFECQLCKKEKQVELEKKIAELKKQKEKIKNEIN